MAAPVFCLTCGAERPAHAPEGLCPGCLLNRGLDDLGSMLSDAGTQDRVAEPVTATTVGASVLAALDVTVGPLPRVLLRDTELAAEAGPAVRPGAPELRRPVDRMARLQLFGEIARGGMGAILRGRDADLGRELAVKVLLEQHRDQPEMLCRFVEEAQIGGQLQHPGIVPVYELGAFADRRPYFAMKLVKGRTLAELLAERPDPTEERPRLLGIFLQVAQTVAYAHAHGVIHRDLKPSNIMVGAFGEVQVMDWGLAKVLPCRGVVDDASAGRVDESDTVITTARSGSGSDLSRAGSVLGTPAYMAPEQARGEVERLDERADVFALGSILCEILTDQPAFTGCSSAEIQRRAARADLTDALARLEGCGANGELIALACDCLAVQPQDRPREADVVAGRLAAYLVGVQERLHASERERAVAEARAVEERRKRRWQLGLAASVAVSLLLGGAGLAGFAAILDRKNTALTNANTALDRQRLRAEDRERQAIDAVKRFRDAVAENPELKDNPRLETLRKALLKEPLTFFRSLRDRLQADGDTRPESLARLAAASFELGRLTEEIGDKQDAMTAYRDALVIRQRLADAHPTAADYQRELAVTHDNLGLLLAATGRPAEARGSHELALAIQQRLAEAHPSVAQYQYDLARNHTNLGLLLAATGHPAEARSSYESALAIWRRLTDVHPAVTVYQRDMARVHNNLGLLLAATGHPAEARGSHESALAIQQRLADAYPTVAEYQRELARSHDNLGLVLVATGHPAEARASHESALAIRQRLADAHPTATEYQRELARTHNNLARLLAATGHPAEARSLYESALAIQHRLVDAHPTVTDYQRGLALTHFNLGLLLAGTGHPAEARSSYEAALALWRRLTDAHAESPDDASNLGGTLNNLAMFDLNAQEFAAAAEQLREAIAWQTKALAAHPRNPTYRLFLRNHYRALMRAARGLDDAGLAAEAERGLAELDASDPRLAALDARLAAVLKGEAARDNAERLDLARRAFDTKRYAAAAMLWAEALAAEPGLAESRQAQHAYNAACAAALAAAGAGQDDPKPDDAARAALRGRALDWLKAELAAWWKVLEAADPETRAAVAPKLRHWKNDPDLAGVRDPDALAALPAAERDAWRALWAEVDALLTQGWGDRPEPAGAAGRRPVTRTPEAHNHCHCPSPRRCLASQPPAPARNEPLSRWVRERPREGIASRRRAMPFSDRSFSGRQFVARPSQRV